MVEMKVQVMVYLTGIVVIVVHDENAYIIIEE
jgi:hypothetical protein